MDQSNFYTGQPVKEGELDQQFSDAQDADNRIVGDQGTGNGGIVDGLEVTEDAPVSLNVKVAAGIAYDAVGQRIRVPTEQTVDMSQDYQSNPTAPPGGQAVLMAPVAVFDRAEADPRVDGLGNPLNYRSLESFQILVRAGAFGPIGSPPMPTLLAGDVPLALVTRISGQSTLADDDIDPTLRYEAWPFNGPRTHDQRRKGHEAVTELANRIELGVGIPFGATSVSSFIFGTSIKDIAFDTFREASSGLVMPLIRHFTAQLSIDVVGAREDGNDRFMGRYMVLLRRSGTSLSLIEDLVIHETQEVGSTVEVTFNVSDPVLQVIVNGLDLSGNHWLWSVVGSMHLVITSN